MCSFQTGVHSVIQTTYQAQMGESLLTDTWEKKSPKFLPVDAVRNQRKLNSHFHQRPWKFFPINNQREVINHEKTLKDLQDMPETSTDLETDKRSIHTKKQANSPSKLSELQKLDILNNVERIISSIEKFIPPPEHKEKVEIINADIENKSQETTNQKNYMKLNQKYMPFKTPDENSQGLLQSFPNFFKRFIKENKAIAKYPMNGNIRRPLTDYVPPNRNKRTDLNSECQPLDNSLLLPNTSNTTLDVNKTFDFEFYKNCILLRKTNVVDLLIKNNEDTTKFLKNALGGDLYSIFKILNNVSVDEINNADPRHQSKNFLSKNQIPTYEEKITVQQLPTEQVKSNQLTKGEIFVSPLNGKENDIENYENLTDYNNLIQQKNKIPEASNLDEYQVQTLEAEGRLVQSLFSKTITDIATDHNNLIQQNNEIPEDPNLNLNEYVQIPEAQDRLVQSPFSETNTGIDDLENLALKYFENYFQYSTYTAMPNIVTEQKKHPNYIKLEQNEKTSKLLMPVEKDTVKELIAANLTNIISSLLNQTEVSKESTPSTHIQNLEKQTPDDLVELTIVKALGDMASSEATSLQKTTQSFITTSSLPEVIHLIITEPDITSTEFETESSTDAI
ncbi:hypothetical protein TNCT_232301 [Trichonephila clavata]|uniref:Uncharacterized protein n=1 Tax=Trichonephila clavata TaxID=2740835 RepID=A0A8X6GMZ4_TRICU|nr:hypothetical protein TNCT_232301 [Trichonephila clavata]